MMVTPERDALAWSSSALTIETNVATKATVTKRIPVITNRNTDGLESRRGKPLGPRSGRNHRWRIWTRFGFEHIFLARPDFDLVSRTIHLHVNRASALRRVRVLRVIAQDVVVARLRVNPLQGHLQPVLIDHCDAARFLR